MQRVSLTPCRRWRSNQSGKCSHERLSRGPAISTMRKAAYPPGCASFGAGAGVRQQNTNLSQLHTHPSRFFQTCAAVLDSVAALLKVVSLHRADNERFLSGYARMLKRVICLGTDLSPDIHFWSRGKVVALEKQKNHLLVPKSVKVANTDLIGLRRFSRFRGGLVQRVKKARKSQSLSKKKSQLLVRSPPLDYAHLSVALSVETPSCPSRKAYGSFTSVLLERSTAGRPKSRGPPQGCPCPCSRVSASYLTVCRKVDMRLHRKENSKLPWRKAGQPSHLIDAVDSDQ